MTEITLSNFEGLLDMAKSSPDDFGYIVVARVIDRSHAARLERKDVDAEALAAFLSLRDASVAADPAELARAALAWAREALGRHLGDADEVTFKVTIFRQKGVGTLRCRHVLVRREVRIAAPPDTVPANVAPSTSVTTPPRLFISENGPMWRQVIREREAAGVPVSELLRGAAHVAEQAERVGVPQRPVLPETIDGFRRDLVLGSNPALSVSHQPSILHRSGGRLAPPGGAAVQRSEPGDTEVERAVYSLVGRSLVGVVQVAVDVSSAAAGVAGAVARAR